MKPTGCLSLMAALLMSSAANADLADPAPRTFMQPDGKEFTVVQRGDERGTWLETAQGYTIDQGPDGYWYYVRRAESGEVRRTQRLAQRWIPAEADFEAHINPHVGDHLPPTFYSGEFDEAELLTGPHEGKVLIVSVEFDDQSGLYHESVWEARIEDADPDARTIAHYYDAASYGLVSLSPAEEPVPEHEPPLVGEAKVRPSTITA